MKTEQIEKLTDEIRRLREDVRELRQASQWPRIQYVPVPNYVPQYIPHYPQPSYPQWQQWPGTFISGTVTWTNPATGNYGIQGNSFKVFNNNAGGEVDIGSAL